jgi:hypothetical protein
LSPKERHIKAHSNAISASAPSSSCYTSNSIEGFAWRDFKLFLGLNSAVQYLHKEMFWKLGLVQEQNDFMRFTPFIHYPVPERVTVGTANLRDELPRSPETPGPRGVSTKVIVIVIVSLRDVRRSTSKPDLLVLRLPGRDRKPKCVACV